MKKFLMFLCAVALVFGMAGSASAIPYTDVYDAGPTGDEGLYMRSHLFSPDDSVEWIFDITDNGFDPLTQDVTSATVTLNFTDDSSWDWFEFAELDVGTNDFRWEVNTGDINFTITSLITLSESGTIHCTLVADGGDFIFNSATLYAEATEPGAAPVPEPSTILLMGSGLLGLVGYSRKRFSKKS